MKDLKFAVIGAGAGGSAMAAILANDGYSVKLSEIDAAKVAKLNELGKIRVTGKIECEGFPELVTTDNVAAAKDADVIMVCTTTDAHKDVANELAPILRDGQIIMLNPGHVGGAMEVANIVRNVHKCKADVIIAEAGDLMYPCRTPQVGESYQSGIKSRITVATLPAGDVDRLLKVLQPVFPCLVAAPNVLETGFLGLGSMLHPIPSLMNMNKLDAQQNYDYYMEGITPTIAKIVVACDKERVAVCKALRLPTTDIIEGLQKIYHLTQTDFYDLIQHNEPYKGLKSPPTFKHRFFVEDTVSGIVPLASVGNMLGVDTPIMNAFIDIGCIACERDFRAEGRTAEKLGLAGKTVDEIYKMIS